MNSESCQLGKRPSYLISLFAFQTDKSFSFGLYEESVSRYNPTLLPNEANTYLHMFIDKTYTSGSKFLAWYQISIEIHIELENNSFFQISLDKLYSSTLRRIMDIHVSKTTIPFYFIRNLYSFFQSSSKVQTRVMIVDRISFKLWRNSLFFIPACCVAFFPNWFVNPIHF